MATATPYKSPPAQVSPPDLLLTLQHAVPPQPTCDTKITDDQTPTLNNAQRQPAQSQVPLSMPEQCVEANGDDGEEINASATGAEVEATGKADAIVEKKAKTTVAAAKPTTSTASAKATAPPPATPPTTAETASEASSTTTRRQTRSMSAAASGVVPTGTQAAAASGKAAASSSSANNPTARTRLPRKKGRPQRAICLSPTPGYESLSLEQAKSDAQWLLGKWLAISKTTEQILGRAYAPSDTDLAYAHEWRRAHFKRKHARKQLDDANLSRRKRQLLGVELDDTDWIADFPEIFAGATFNGVAGAAERLSDDPEPKRTANPRLGKARIILLNCVAPKPSCVELLALPYYLEGTHFVPFSMFCFFYIYI
jgi:hypothetical protein